MAMLRHQKLRIFLLGTLVVSSAVTGLARQRSELSKDDRSWKQYANRQTGYCVSYPRRWQKGDAFEGAGMYALTGTTRSSLPAGALDITAFPDAPAALTKISLSGDMQAHLDGLRKYVKAEETQVLEERRLTVAGAEALLLKARYFDPRERSFWVEEVLLTRRNGMLYRMELQSRADQIRRFEPVFARFAASFQFDCHSPR